MSLPIIANSIPPTAPVVVQQPTPKKEGLFNWKNLLIFGAGAGVAGILVYSYMNKPQTTTPVPPVQMISANAYENVFTDAGLPNNRQELEAMLIARGYNELMIQQLQSANVWELQCIVAAQIIKEKHAIIT